MGRCESERRKDRSYTNNGIRWVAFARPSHDRPLLDANNRVVGEMQLLILEARDIFRLVEYSALFPVEEKCQYLR